MGKGSKRRPHSPHVSQAEVDLRWALWLGEITKNEFDEGLKKIRSKKDGT